MKKLLKKSVINKDIFRILSFVMLISSVWICEYKQVSAAAGIANNGTGGIYIDINSAPYTTFAQIPTHGKYAYGASGCAWFASARVNQITGKGNMIYSGTSWWGGQGENLGFSKGYDPKAPAIICYRGHVAILEKIEGNTAYLSEGGVNQYCNWGDWNNYASSNSYTAIHAIEVGEIKSWCNQRNDFLGFIYLKPTHTHSYTSSVTKQPTCTATGVRTYKCSCGNSYTETIAAKGHSYKNTVVAPTTTEKGYTLHKCSVCGNSYKDNYVNPPSMNSDGYYHCASLPSGVTSDKYTIQYNNYYEKIQANSPGNGWTNAGKVKDTWENSGGTYESESDLATSNSRVLVRSVYYHFCGPNAGNMGNYEMTGNYVHYDEVDPAYVNVTSSGMDGSHPWYVLAWKSGGTVWCQSGSTCDGSYGSHGARCKAWYKKNVYQNKVHVVQYKFTKNSGWIATKDSSAKAVEVRYKKKETAPAVTLSGITAKKTKVSYYVGDTININDITVTAVYSNKTTKSIALSKCTTNLSSINTSSAGTKTLVIQYVENGKTVKSSIALQVTEKPAAGQNKDDGDLSDDDWDSFDDDNLIMEPMKVTGLKLKAKGSGNLSITWNVAGNADKYNIQIATKKNFKSGKKSKKTTAAKYTWKKLKRGKTYYVRVRGYNLESKKYGTWSKVKKVKVK